MSAQNYQFSDRAREQFGGYNGRPEAIRRARPRIEQALLAVPGVAEELARREAVKKQQELMAQASTTVLKQAVEVEPEVTEGITTPPEAPVTTPQPSAVDESRLAEIRQMIQDQFGEAA